MRDIAVRPLAPPNLDFTSALYLGIDHDWASLRPWPKLTLGKPAALHAELAARRIRSLLTERLGGEPSIAFALSARGQKKSMAQFKLLPLRSETGLAPSLSSEGTGAAGIPQLKSRLKTFHFFQSS